VFMYIYEEICLNMYYYIYLFWFDQKPNINVYLLK